ncbi:MAG: hypothetical protein ING61_11350 [Rhodocyclaceae bacterium]|nr:hypothetical protein [Rhodocyclaceae bacterium]MCA3064058.1 hypothetical protein [Rhodocyclaceae bacterium]MCA3087518.1 hypothetical protein [Rhodocyclaceae bacterium]
MLSQKPNSTVALWPLLKFPVLPLAVVFACASVFFFPAQLAPIFFFAVACDAIASFRGAELNAKQQYGISAVGNLLNYPVMLALLLLIATDHPLTIGEGLGCFALSSVVRATWLCFQHNRISRGTQLRATTVENVPLTGMQGITNWALFRADQLALLYIPLLAITSFDETRLTQYIFLTRIPEIGTGILVLFGTVYFPKYFLPNDDQQAERSTILRLYLKLAGIVFTLGACVGLLALPLFNGPRIDFVTALPFLLQLPLILWANLVTYSMQSQGRLAPLVTYAALAGVAGLALIAVLIGTNCHKMLAWVVPLQLSIFILLGLRRPSNLHKN